MQTREPEERDVFCGSEDVRSEKRKKPKARERMQTREAEEREMCSVEVFCRNSQNTSFLAI